MPKIHRLTGRFFAVLISLSLAICLPHTAAAGTKSPSPTLCQISDTVYRADGSPAQGTVLVSWQSFTTSAGQAVTPGSLLVTLDASGGFNASLAPNTGASPAGTYYKAIFKLSDGTTETEFWVVPNTQTTTIGAIRSKLVPSQQAAQFLTRDYADSTYVSLASTQTISGVKTFSASPAVPTPQNPTDAANKSYVDNNSGGAQQLLGQANTWSGKQTFSVSPAVPTPQSSTDAASKSYVDANSANLSSPPPIGNVAPNSVAATSLTTAQFPYIDVRAFGAVGDAVQLGSCSITAGQTLLTCNGPAGKGFSSASAGKTILVQQAGAAIANTTNPLITTIASYVNGTQVNLSTAAVNSASNAGAIYGTDNAAAFCAATQCTTVPYTGVYANGVATGRELYIPGGSYLTTKPLYCRANMTCRGAGQAATQITLATVQNPLPTAATANFATTNITPVICMGNASAGPGTCSGESPNPATTGVTGPSSVYDLLAASMGATTVGFLATGQGANNSNLGSAYYFHNIWTETFYGLVGYRTQFGSVEGFEGDTGTICVAILGDGTTTTTSIKGWQINDSHLGGCEWGVWLNGASDITINSNNFDWNYSHGGAPAAIMNYSPQGYASHKIVIGGNDFFSNGTAPNLNFIELAAPCGDCKITGNTFSLASLAAILFDSGAAGTTGLLIDSNQFVSDGAASAAPEINNAGGAAVTMKISNNIFDSPNYYGLFSSNANVILGDNQCSNPFAANAPLSNNDYQRGCFHFSGGSPGTIAANNNSVTSSGSTKYPAVSIDSTYTNNTSWTSGNRSDYTYAVALKNSNNGCCSSWNEQIENAAGTSIPPATLNPANGNATFAALSYQNVPGVQFLVSKYASIQAAISAAYNNGTVLGAVIDDRTAPYSGPGFILYDSVTLKLAATTYTITSTVTYNNGNNNVTAGIVLVPGAHLVGAGTSSNHGTILQPGNGLNADLIASSTVGTGTGASVQWWHWGEIGNIRIVGNGANQTAGECLKIENMGETAKVHDLELSACYSNNLEIIGASATQSAISNVTSNLSVGGAGVAFTNLGGVGVLGGISGDCNHTALIAANFGASGTLQINGLKAEAESSICASQVQDPVILSTTTDSTVLASIKVDGGYAFGSTQHDFLKSTGPGSIQYLQNNFYLTGYTNILNDTVRSQVLPNLSTTIKQPVSYLSNGTIFGNQAFWFQPNTFIQGNPNGTPTELFGLTSSGGAVLAAPGNGDNANPGTGGIQISSYNRSIFGQTPEPMARWGWRFLGSGGGYDTTKWDLVPVWAAGDSSDRSIGNASTTCQNGSGSVSCRWPHVYALNVDTNTFTLNGNSLATVATSGNYNDLTNKPVIPAQGAHLVSGTMQGQTAQITGTGSYATLYSATIPAGTAGVGTGLKCRAYFRHTIGSATVAMQWKLGSTSQAYATTFTGGNSGSMADIEIFTPSSTNSEIVNIPYTYFGGTLNGPATGLAWSENLTSANIIYLQFNVAATDKLTGDTFYCQTVQ